MILLAWMDHDMFDCSTCNDNRKRANGCTSRPRRRDGTEYDWHFPPDRPEISVDTCPANVINESPDIVEAFRSLNLASSGVDINSQQELPQPYLEALSLIGYHQSAKSSWKIKQDSKRVKHGHR